MAKRKLNAVLKKFLKRKRRGSVLALAVVVMMILLATGTGLLKLGLNSRLLAISHSSEIEARAAADAGLTKAICLLNQQLADGTLLRTRFGSDLSYSAFPAETNTSLESSNASYTYAVAGNPTSGYTVQCTGTSGRVSKTITSTLKLQSPFDCAVFTESGLSLGPGSVFDWINYDLDDYGLQIGTNSTENDAIVLGAKAVINADILVGPGGIPENIIKDGGAQVSGDIGALPAENELSTVTVPSSLVSRISGGDIITSKTINTSGKYKNIDLSNSDVLKISGVVTLYVTDNVKLDNSAQIQIDNTTPSSLNLYPVSYTHLRAHETLRYLVCRLLLEKKKTKTVEPQPKPGCKWNYLLSTINPSRRPNTVAFDLIRLPP